MKNKSVNLADKLFPKDNTLDSEEFEILNIPPEQRKLNTETYDFTVSTINGYINDKHIIIPDFQRGYVWNRSQASRLIESLIIQCPIPVVFLSQNTDETLSVIDGNQRLSSINLFLQDKFPLQGLTAYPELDGFTFSDLDPRFKRHIQNRTIRCIVILKDTHPQIKFDVFERLNTGSVKLNAQELRHGIHSGRLMSLLEDIAKTDKWKAASGISKDKRMKSEELVLRFLALSENWRNYEQPLSGFLSKFSEKYRNPSPKQEAQFKEAFESALDRCCRLFGTHVFRTVGADKRKLQFNAALYDAQMIAAHEIDLPPADLAIINKQAIHKATLTLLNDESFSRHISQATTNKNALLGRIKQFTKHLRDLM
ncbi:MAG: DUF262 domain-containing protein [Verrucomicrobiota bacterium]